MEENRPGFQGSETTWVEVTVHQHDQDPIIISPKGPGMSDFSGKDKDQPVPIVVNVSKAMGMGSGQFQMQLKPNKAAESLFKQLVDDDWVDIVFYRHNQPWHVMRGLIDEIRRSQIVAGNGATVTTYLITGRDFGKIWETTPVWFSPYADNDLVTDAVIHQVMQAMPTVVGKPSTAVFAYMNDFLESVKDSAGTDWQPPPSMPGVGDTFLGSVGFDFISFQNRPGRKAFNPNYLAPNGTLWSLAQQYSDPEFTELWVDLLPNNDPLAPEIKAGDPIPAGNAKMTVVLRDKPFPVVSADEYGEDLGGFVSHWNDIPVITIPRQQVREADLGRSGFERFNAFFVASRIHQEAMGAHALSILAPLVDLRSIKRHGMRRYDVQSEQSPDDLDFGLFAEQQRRIIRDWYCMNPYLLSGNINLTIGRPDIKLGTRVRIPGAVSEEEDESYYVEQWSHNWAFGRGARTTLGVTRGWIGSDDSYIDALKTAAGLFSDTTILSDADRGIVTG